MPSRMDLCQDGNYVMDDCHGENVVCTLRGHELFGKDHSCMVRVSRMKNLRWRFKT
jgi:hypothetical protein